MTLTKSELIRRAAERASRDDFFIGSILNQYMAIHCLDRTKMARELSCSGAQLSKLALCRVPHHESKSFRAEVESISNYTGISPLHLGKLIREVQSTRALETTQKTTHHNTGLLLAARDRFDDPQNDPKRRRKGQNKGMSTRRRK